MSLNFFQWHLLKTRVTVFTLVISLVVIWSLAFYATVARFGGDEFVVMISELSVDKSEATTQAGVIARKISATLANPYVLKIRHEGKGETTVEHCCTVSIGVALFDKHETSQEDVLKRADIVMYQAKEAGRNLIRFYDSKA